MKLRAILLGASAFALLPSLAMAAPEGFYVGIGAGANWTEDADVKLQTPLLPSLKSEFKWGGIADAQLGYSWASGLRTELEFAWRWRNKVDGTSSAAPALNGLGGKIRSEAYMANVLYEFETGWGFRPYVGAGAGGARVKFDLGNASDKDWVFAYQGIVGAAMDLTPNLALTLDYRYFATNDPKFDFGPVTAKSEYRNHTVLAGLRYTFGAPPPPASVPAAPPPVADQAVQNEFLVFFDWDRAEITPASDAIIGDAADSAGKVRAIKLEVIGHTDTSGSPSYNQRLSLRRAEAVRQALIAKGVPANLITIEGRGETQLMVNTGTNVREPSNRRAQMLIRVS